MPAYVLCDKNGPQAVVFSKEEAAANPRHTAVPVSMGPHPSCYYLDFQIAQTNAWRAKADGFRKTAEAQALELVELRKEVYVVKKRLARSTHID